MSVSVCVSVYLFALLFFREAFIAELLFNIDGCTVVVLYSFTDGCTVFVANSFTDRPTRFVVDSLPTTLPCSYSIWALSESWRGAHSPSAGCNLLRCVRIAAFVAAEDAVKS